MRLPLLALLLALSPVLPLRAQTLNSPGFKAPGAALVTSSAALDAKAEISVVGGGEYAGFTAIYSDYASLKTISKLSGRAVPCWRCTD